MFLQRTSLLAGFLAGAASARQLLAQSAAPPKAKFPELRIARLVVQKARGRRLTPVAPNAYAPYRGYEVNEPILRVVTAQGLEGIARYPGKPESVKWLLGKDPFALFQWTGGIVTAPVEQYRTAMASLYGADVALFDLLGKALRKPAADLLGKPVRHDAVVYDSSLYMEDLLKPAEREGLAYLKSVPKDPAQQVARKAEWVLAQPEGIQVLKIKIGRAKWMASFQEALERDIAVVKAIHQAVGRNARLFVDGNDGYQAQPLRAADFAEAVADTQLLAMEEMFKEDKLSELREVKRRMRAAGMKTKLADGENRTEGIPEQICAERFEGAQGREPLFDIEQADMNANGYLRLLAIAANRAGHGMTMAPHNFASKMGFYTQVHLAMVTPNWEFCETDDSQIPALRATGIEIKSGRARLTGKPGIGVEVEESALDEPALLMEK